MLSFDSLISYAPFAAILVVGCAGWAAVSLRSASRLSAEALTRAKAATGPVKDSLQRTADALGRHEVEVTLRRDLARRAATAEIARSTAAAMAGEADSAPQSLGTEVSPLEREKQEWIRWLDSLERRLDRWADLARAPAGFMNDLRRDVHRTQAAMAKITNEEKMAIMRREVKSLEEETMRTVVAKTDRDLDPRGTDQRLRSLLSETVKFYDLELIDPARGTQPDSRLHRGVGVVPASSPAARGTIAGVRTRGLCNSEGDILSPAEIIEFD